MTRTPFPPSRPTRAITMDCDDDDIRESPRQQNIHSLSLDHVAQHPTLPQITSRFQESPLPPISTPNRMENQSQRITPQHTTGTRNFADDHMMDIDSNRLPQNDSEEETKDEEDPIRDSNTLSVKPSFRCGLVNLGNTCYMNSVLQALTSCGDFSRYFLKTGDIEITKRKPNKNTKSTLGELVMAYSDLLSNMKASKETKPAKLKMVIGKRSSMFAGYDQHDAQEFLRFFLDEMHEDINRISEAVPYEEIKDIANEKIEDSADRWWSHYEKRNDSHVKDLFAGQLFSHVKCDVCSHDSFAFDPILDISLPIFSDDGPSDPTLESCFENFTKQEQLDEYYCQKCKTHQPSKRTIQIYRVPDLLVVHLKRFQQIGMRRSKITCKVKLPLGPEEVLDIAKFSRPQDDTRYRLRSIVNHMGSLHGGHYVCNARINDSDSWYNFNDQYLTKVEPRTLDESSAYLLFFERVRRDNSIRKCNL